MFRSFTTIIKVDDCCEKPKHLGAPHVNFDVNFSILKVRYLDK
jgi:hypothetical protein